MTEEQVTKGLLEWLQGNTWEILSYDFPQSGTGTRFHPNDDKRIDTKNKGSVIPDIIAKKNEVGIFWENKDRYDKGDFDKIEHIKTSGEYSNSLTKYLKINGITSSFWGIGMLDGLSEIKKITQRDFERVNFICVVNDDKEVRIIHQPYKEIIP